MEKALELLFCPFRYGIDPWLNADEVPLNGYFPEGGWTLSLIGIIPTFAGMFIGLKLFSKINVDQVKKLLNWFMVVMGLFLFVSNLIK